MNRISGLAPTAALLALSLLASFAPAAFAGEPGGARELLLSGDYFSEFYGVDAADVLTFDASNRSLALPFASNRSVGRSCLDAPLKLDCSKFSAFEIAFSVDDERAIGFATLYFNLPRVEDSCRGTQIISWSSAISLLKSRFPPRFTAICRAEKVVNPL